MKPPKSKNNHSSSSANHVEFTGVQNSVDSGFRKIVKRLFIIVAITMVTVGAYLYFNFTAPSNLPVIVPSDATFFVQFQTRKIRDELKTPPQAELDSLVKTVSQIPALNWVSNPADLGIALFSDVVYFQTNQYRALAFSLNSEPRFRLFLDSLKKLKYVSGLVESEKYSYTEIQTPGWENTYIGFKHKAMVIIQFQPQKEIRAKNLKELFAISETNNKFLSDTALAPLASTPSQAQRKNTPKSTSNVDDLQFVLGRIFTGDGNGFVKNPVVQKLYDEGALILMTNGKDIADSWKLNNQNQIAELKLSLQYAHYKLIQLKQNGL